MEQKITNSVNIFKVLGDCTRLKILDTIMNEEKTVNSIVSNTEVTQSCVSHQLRLLKQANIVRSQRRGKCVYYALKDASIKLLLEQTFLHAVEEKI